MDNDRDYRDMLLPGEMGMLIKSDKPKATKLGLDGDYETDFLDDDCSDEAKRLLAHVDRWLSGKEPGLPEEFRDGSTLGSVAEKLALRILSLVLRLRVEHWGAAHNSAVMFKLGRRASGREKLPDEKQQAVELFDSLVAQGKKKAVAEKAVKEQFGVSPRTLRNWRAGK